MSTSRSLRVLYICYFPITEPLVQTQVVAYLAGLSLRGHHIHLLTYETETHDPATRRKWARRLKEQGITWHHLRYHRRPSLPATMYDAFCGVLTGLRIMRRYRLNTVHARSHVPAAMGLILKKLTGCRLIFDIRGLLAEEYVDANNWQEGNLPYRLTKTMEKRCINDSDGIVVLTERVKAFLFDNDNRKLVEVIPCCADLTNIEARLEHRNATRTQLGISHKTVMIYTGKLGGWYMYPQMVEFFKAARDIIPNLHFLVLTQSDQSLIAQEFAQNDVSPNDFTITRVEPSQVANYLSAADFAIAFYKPCFSVIACSPTKIGEYWAAGLPVVCSAGVGDMDAIIAKYNIGVSINDFTSTSYCVTIRQMLTLLSDKMTPERCHRAAQENASLENVGIPLYQTLYAAVAQADVELLHYAE